MAKDRRDNQTLDLLDWEGPQVAVRFKDRALEAANLPRKVSLAVAKVLKDSGMSREEIAAATSRRQ